MAIVTAIDEICKWVEENICPEVQLKAADNESQDDGYPYKLVHPAVFPMYAPTEDKLPEGVVSSVPSITVRVTTGTDSPAKGKRELKVTLLFAVWSPGLHRGDYLTTTKVERTGGIVTKIITTQGPGEDFREDAEGWRDAWNFVDTAIRIIENDEFLGNYRFMKERDLTFTPVNSQNATSDYFPFWYAAVDFSVEEAISVQRKHTHYENLL